MGDTRKEEAEFSLRKKYHKTIFSRFARAINHYQLVENGDHVAVFVGHLEECSLEKRCSRISIPHRAGMD